jgi:hypothetical protein
MGTKARTFALEALLIAVGTCMGGRGWKRVEVSVVDTNQFRGPGDAKDFLNPPPPLGGKRYNQNR